MKKENDKKIEEFLDEFSFKPVSPALKEKMLNNALQRKKTNHVMPHFFWRDLVGCLILLVFVITIDSTLNHVQNKHFASIVHKQKESIDLTEEERSFIKDIILDFSDSTESTANRKFFGLGNTKKNTWREWDRRKSFEEELE
jgi:hypothetical protein